MTRGWRLIAAALAAILAWALSDGTGWAGRISDIRNTRHNLSATAPAGNTVRTSESEVCVFCHTPHAATHGAPPLWNRTLSSATYTTYHSSSLDASPGDIGLDQPDGTSKLCLSCHDGTIAIGQVNVLSGKTGQTITTSGTDTGGTMPQGKGATSGYSRKLGTDLTNDHPISFTYSDALATTDGELQLPSSSGGSPRTIDSRSAGYRPKFPLENGKLQCTTCHDPHIRDDNPAEGNIKFLRQNRFQKAAPTSTYSSTNDILCLACHTKAGWKSSAHADPTVATQTYTNTAATNRDFPANTTVWQAACLNCHDTHTVQGARRLLRLGTNGGLNASNVKAGGASAIEETCYACHSPTGTNEGTVLVNQGNASFAVPDVRTDFNSLYHMPIAETPEVHDIGNAPGITQPGKDGIESQALLNQRHAECPDCHNPHRTMKNRLAVGTGSAAAGTHDHKTANQHSNLASGVLRGAWGVEPNYSSTTFGIVASSFTVKRGDPGTSTTMAVTDPYVTREYQICLKCHSSYAYGSVVPNLGLASGSSPSGTNGLTQYTDQAMEFQAPVGAQGEPGGNHRSWHPVMKNTGRTTDVRKAGAGNWLSPWNQTANIGNQTMYCSDCHGSNTASGTVIPGGNADPQTDAANTENGAPWGPHGSSNPFILKGSFSSSTGSGNSGDLCFRCHNYSLYATRGGGSSGFGGSKDSNLHSYHADKLGKMRCTWCHVAVPHGWKNKALLVNLNDVGNEDGISPSVQVRNNTTAAYTRAPYYLNAVLKVKTWATSGSWSDSNCGSKGAPGNNQTGRDWMRDSNENCKSAP